MPEVKHLNPLDYAVVLVYLLTVAGLGVYLRRSNRDTADYFKAGGKLPWLLASVSLFVSGFSAYMFVAASGFVYRTGLVSALLFTSAFGAYWLGFFVYGRLWRRARLQAPMEFLTRRFSQSTTYFYSLVAVLPNILLMGALFYTLTIFISSALGFGDLQVSFGAVTISGFELTLVTIGLVVLLYTVLGGLWAVVVTDTVQFIILMVVTLLVFPMSLAYLGQGNPVAGLHNLVQQSPPDSLTFDFAQVTPAFLLAFWFMNLLGYNGNWHVGQRYYSVPDERDTRKMAAVCALFSLIAPLLWILPVLVARVLFPDLASLWPELTEPTEAAFVTLCLVLLPHGFLGVVVSAMLAASMSSADTTCNWLAAVLTKDVYVPLTKRLRPGRTPSEKQQLVVARVTVLVVGVLAILTSLGMRRFGSAFNIYLQIYSLTVPALFMPVVVGFVYRKTPWWSAVAASSAGIVSTLAVAVWANVSAGLPLRGLADLFSEVKLALLGVELGRYELNVFTGAGVSLAVFLVSSRWPDRSPTHVARLAALERDLRAPAHESPTAFDVHTLQAYEVVAVIAGAVGLLLMSLSFVEGGFPANFLGGLGAALFGGLFWALARKYAKRNPERP